MSRRPGHSPTRYPTAFRAPSHLPEDGQNWTLTANLAFLPQGPPASGQASEVLKETRGTLDPLESPAKWATQDLAAPLVTLASQD